MKSQHRTPIASATSIEESLLASAGLEARERLRLPEEQVAENGEGVGAVGRTGGVGVAAVEKRLRLVQRVRPELKDPGRVRVNKKQAMIYRVGGGAHGARCFRASGWGSYIYVSRATQNSGGDGR